MDRKSVLQVLFCYVLWGCLPVFWKLLQGLGALYILATRIVWSFLFCLLVLLLQRRGGELRAALRAPGDRRRLLCAAVLIGVNWGAFIYAVNSGRLLDSSLAYFLNPLLTILLGFLVFRERLRPAQWAALLLAFGGILAAVLQGGGVPWLALLIGGSFAGYGAVKKNVRCDGMVSTCAEAMLLTPVSLLYLLFAALRGQGASGVLAGASLLLLPLSGVVTAIPLLSFSQGVRRVPLSLTGILMYVNPTLQMLLGLLLYHETLSPVRAIMFLCVWAALAVYLISARRAAARTK